MRRFTIGTVIALALIIAGTTAMAQSKVVTFDNGDEGWHGNHFNEILDDGGEQGAYLNTTSIDYANNNAVLVGWYDTWNDSDPAFIGDYTQKGEVRICVDINVNIFDFLNWGGWIAVEEYREVIINLRDLDMQWTDPNYPQYPYPYAEAQFLVNYMHSREDGWATYCADVTDVDSMELPEGWTGYGGPEDPNTYMPTLPPDYGWTGLLAGVDEVRINALAHGYYYSYNFIYDIDFDNISIGPIPQYCAGAEATVFVDDQGMIHGGMFDGREYGGVLKGTSDSDIIVGTSGNDTITGFDGDDIICGMGGNDNLMGLHGADFIDGGEGDDNLHGQAGDDFLTGGEGDDHLNGGPGNDTCLHGEIVGNCGEWESITAPGLRIVPFGSMVPPVTSGQPVSFDSLHGQSGADDDESAPNRSPMYRNTNPLRDEKAR